MLSDTLTEGLQQYAIGEKVRRLRLRKKMGLVELGRHAGLSAAMLSKVECGRLFPTLPTLLRIAMVFNVGLEHFFTDGSHTVAVARKKDRLVFEEKFGGSEAAYRFECLDFKAGDRKLNAFYAEFPKNPPARPRSHEHDGAEFIYVLSGSLAVKLGDKETLLRKEDAIYFDSTVAHGYRALGNASCSAVVVTFSLL
jgi:transcriptional regulator with XRE-family HTH domain